MINKFISFVVVFLVGSYVLDEMTKSKRISVIPSPFRYFRNKLYWWFTKPQLSAPEKVQSEPKGEEYD